MPWEEFLRQKCDIDSVLERRRDSILKWMEKYRRRAVPNSEGIAEAMLRIDSSIEEYGAACTELRAAVQMTRLIGAPDEEANLAM